tara:strand:+ start:1011 stop:1343 length:333 start_codon:yes stop_codon:yes gene_type:complete
METQKVIDNYLKSFPARMSDGRFITDYTPNCDKNLLLQKNMSSWEYRSYLMNNAEKLIEEEKKTMDDKFGCLDCNSTQLLDSSVKQVCNHTGCNIEVLNKEGIGIEQVNE